MDTKELLKELSNCINVSGFEFQSSNIIVQAFKEYSSDISIDNLGNIIALKKGKNNESNLKVMIAAHMDEIGLMVKGIEDNGFIRFTNIGGIDPRTILGQEVIVHGKKELFGVIVSKPPHLQDELEQKKAIKIEELFIDVGYSKEDVDKLISIGDVITINREFKELQGNRVTGKALDDKAGIACMYECIKELSKIEHEFDVYFVSTVQEEVGIRGAYTSTYKINPDIGIAIDVGFGSTPELPKHYTIDMGKGPAITIGGNIHPGLRDKLINVAKEYNIPFQIEVVAGPTGTDANAMQITREGIPTLCISIPLRYMHTSVEVVDMNDIKNTAKLIAFFISSISKDNLEGLLCY